MEFILQMKVKYLMYILFLFSVNGKIMKFVEKEHINQQNLSIMVNGLEINCIKNIFSDGYGIYKLLNGYEYNGNFKDGKMDGKGILTSKDGKKYDCIFKEGTLIQKTLTNI